MPHKGFDFFPMRNFGQTTGPGSRLPTEERDTEFKLKYPPDTLGEELADKARVWQVYRDYAIAHDDKAVEAWTNTVDILLTFAGLFSAVVTAFVIESYQQLQPDTSNNYLARALYALVIATNDSVAISMLSTPPASSTSSLQGVRLVNALWFTSLFLSLSAALLCMLVKQWLDKYLERTRPQAKNPKHWSRRRAFYYQGVETWRVAEIVSLIPVLLHIAVFCFLGGLGFLLWPLDHGIAAWLVSCSALAAVAYVLSVVMALRDEAWPFTTTLTDQLNRLRAQLVLRLGLGVSEVAAAISSRLQRCWLQSQTIGAVCPHPRSIRMWLNLHHAADISPFDQVLHLDSLRVSDRGVGSDCVLRLEDTLDYEALSWLAISVSDSDASAVGFQALSAVEPLSALHGHLSAQSISRDTSGRDWLLATSLSSSPTEAARVIRSKLIVGHDMEPADRSYYLIDSSFLPDAERYRGFLSLERSYPDFQLLDRALSLPGSVWRLSYDPDYASLVKDAPGLSSSPSLHSTALILACLNVAKQPHTLLFLLCCDLELITPTQWNRLMQKLRRSHACPRHSHTIACDLLCLMELLSGLLLGHQTLYPAPGLDRVVLRKLCGEASASLRVPLSDFPNFLEYVSSNAFADDEHSAKALHATMGHFLDASTWNRIPAVDATWFRAWHHAAYVSHRQSGVVLAPTELILSALQDCAQSHEKVTTSDYDVHVFEIPVQRDTIASMILCALTGIDQPIPTIWDIIVKGSPGLKYQMSDTAGVLAAFLCARSRTTCDVEIVDELVTGFFAPLALKNLLAVLFVLARGPSEVQAWTSAITLCLHIMELRPSWWIEGLKLLLQEEEYHSIETRWYDKVRASYVQKFAMDITKVCLRRGPCSNCCVPATAPELDVSLYAYMDSRGITVLDGDTDA